jgi:NDP-sugar pyrophosphorylase family protein
MLRPVDFFDLSDPAVAAFFADLDYVWELLPRLAGFVAELTEGQQRIEGEVMAGAHLSDRPVYIGPGAIVEPGAYIQGPAYIAAGATVKHGGFVRENVILMPGAIVGHATEAKNSLFLPNAHAPHFNYVGDSILGQRTNLGAGTKLSNLALTNTPDSSGQRPSIKLHIHEQEYDMGVAKMGAILGDDAQTGCNAVLNPGTIIGPRSMVYANLSVRKGYYPPDSVLKLRQTTRTAPRL